MKCPVCRTVDLAMTERAGVEIDYCPQCRGVWLDRGELDKIMLRADQGSGHTAPPMMGGGYRGNDDSGEYPSQQPGQPYPPKKKKHWLHDLFD